MTENIQDALMHVPVWIRVLWGWCMGATAGIAWTKFAEIRRELRR